MPTVIRPMLPADMDRVLAIERQCHGYPWPAEIFHDELAAPHAHIDLLEEEGEIAGFLVWWLVAGEIEIQNVATALRHRRRGVGRQLLEHLLARAAELQVTRLLLEVRVGNEGAIALYRAFGFVDCGRRRCYYPDGEDALLMERLLA